MAGKNKVIKKILIAVLAVFAVFVILASVFYYRVCIEENEILKTASQDNCYELAVFMVGEPVFPYGPAHCRFIFAENGNRITKYDFDIFNDGAFVNDENFVVEWQSDRVLLTAHGEEQPNTLYTITFDGEVTEKTGY